jgi:two-component system chemotaxis response regulator CheB
MPKTPITVLLVDDSPLVLAVLKRILSASPDLQVVATAKNGKEALELIPRLKPGIVCTDLHMPEVNGLELTKQIMAKHPCPILVVSDYVQKEDQSNVFQLLEAGALDVFPKPRSGQGGDYDRLAQELITKIKLLSGVVVFRKMPGAKAAAATASGKVAKTELPAGHPYRLLAIGASTGGPNALQALLSGLSEDFPAPIVCVQHISEGFLLGMVDWLSLSSAVRVTIAKPGETPQPGIAYFAQDGAHLEFDQEGRFSASKSEPFQGHRPSVNVLFDSVAQTFGKASVAVLLTGMGKDGAQGMQTIAQAGGLTIAQNEESSLVFGMPKEAIALNAVSHVMPLSEMAPALKSVFGA